MIRLYTLADDGVTPVRTENVHAWADWFTNTNREHAGARLSDSDVRLVFIGCDNAETENAPPYVWEVVNRHVDGSSALVRFSCKRKAMDHFCGMVEASDD